MLLNSHTHLKYANNNSIVCGTSKGDWDKVAKYKYHALGIHPWFVENNFSQDIQILEEKIKQQKVIAIGEIGLDFHIKTDQNLQLKIFNLQLNLAQKYNLPVVIHAVKSLDKIINILSKYTVIAQIHGFNGSEIQGQKLLNLGHYLGFGYYKKSLKLQEFIKNTPTNKILIETDEKDSKYLSAVVIEIANLRKITITEMVKICDKNANTLFGKIT